MNIVFQYELEDNNPVIRPWWKISYLFVLFYIMWFHFTINDKSDILWIVKKLFIHIIILRYNIKQIWFQNLPLGKASKISNLGPTCYQFLSFSLQLPIYSKTWNRTIKNLNVPPPPFPWKLSNVWTESDNCQVQLQPQVELSWAEIALSLV